MSLNRTPHTFAGEAATSTRMNNEVTALWDGLQDSWDTYTPAWIATGTNPSLGNGIIGGRYIRIGKTLKWRIAIHMGSTTTFGVGSYRFELPFELDWAQHDAIGSAAILNNSAGTVYGFTVVYDGLTSGVPYAACYGSDSSPCSANSPIVFDNGDRIALSGIGELP